MKQAMRELGVDDASLPPRLALSRISHAKNRMEGPDAFTASVWSPRDQQLGKLYEPVREKRWPTPARSTSTTCC